MGYCGLCGEVAEHGEESGGWVGVRRGFGRGVFRADPGAAAVVGWHDGFGLFRWYVMV